MHSSESTMGARRAGSYHGPATTRKAGTAPASQETTMRNTIARGPWALIACLALALPAITQAPAQAQKKYDTGASDTEIRIGNFVPYSGPVSYFF